MKGADGLLPVGLSSRSVTVYVADLRASNASNVCFLSFGRNFCPANLFISNRIISLEFDSRSA